MSVNTSEPQPVELDLFKMKFNWGMLGQPAPVFPGFDQVGSQKLEHLPDILHGNLCGIIGNNGLPHADLIHHHSGFLEFLPDHPEAALADHILYIDGGFLQQAFDLM